MTDREKFVREIIQTDQKETAILSYCDWIEEYDPKRIQWAEHLKLYLELKYNKWNKEKSNKFTNYGDFLNNLFPTNLGQLSIISIAGSFEYPIKIREQEFISLAWNGFFAHADILGFQITDKTPTPVTNLTSGWQRKSITDLVTKQPPRPQAIHDTEPDLDDSDEYYPIINQDAIDEWNRLDRLNREKRKYGITDGVFDLLENENLPISALEKETREALGVPAFKIFDNDKIGKITEVAYCIYGIRFHEDMETRMILEETVDGKYQKQ